MVAYNLLTQSKGCKLLLLVSAVFCSHISLSQGAWDIEYLIVDSISSKDIGREVRLDFKTSNFKKPPNHIRGYLSVYDTGILFINKIYFELREYWKIYPDHGVCSEQFLVSSKEISPGISLYLGNSVIKEITKDSILISSEIELRKSYKKRSKIIEKKTEEIWVERNKLSGFLYRKN